MADSHLIPRPQYDSQLERYRDTDFIKVLKGVRRCGKSSILALYQKHLEEEGIPPRNLIRRRFDEFDMAMGISAEDLKSDLASALEQASTDYPAYVFLDEIQMVHNWEYVVRGLQTRPHTDVYITGSNAYLLSSDLATLLAGRYMEINVYPLSFAEYKNFSVASNRSAMSDEEAFSQYMRFGGMPGLFALRELQVEDIALELSGIYDSVILNDVAKRFAIRDLPLLDKLVAYVFTTSGNLFSTKSIVNYLRSSGQKASQETIEGYLYSLQQALVLHEVKQEGLQGKNILRPLRKFYPVDTGFRNLPRGFAIGDTGYQLENVVYIELLRRGFTVSVGRAAKSEIDFVARKNDQIIYVQVAEELSDDVMERELSAFRAVRDSFPKMLLTTDRLRVGITPEGFQIVNIIDWLLGATSTEG